MAVEIPQPKGVARIRLRRLTSESKERVRQFFQDSVEPGAVVRADGSGSQAMLPKITYPHERHVMHGSDIPAHVSMARIHRGAFLLEPLILGTHHGSIRPAHLHAYLDESGFRLNLRVSISRGILLYGLHRQAVVTDPVTYQDIICTDLESGRAPTWIL